MRKIAERKFNLASILLMLFSVTFCALTVLAADEKTVRIVVDNQEKNFIKTPILTDDQAILVSLEDFAESSKRNGTVGWGWKILCHRIWQYGIHDNDRRKNSVCSPKL